MHCMKKELNYSCMTVHVWPAALVWLCTWTPLYCEMYDHALHDRLKHDCLHQFTTELELWIASPCTLLWTQTSARHVNQTVVHFDIKQLILHKLFRFYEFKLHFHIEQLLPTTIKQLLPTHHFIPHRCFRYSVCIPSSLFNSFAGVVACVYLELVSYFGAFSSSQTN